jgi:hypothetical protein
MQVSSEAGPGSVDRDSIELNTPMQSLLRFSPSTLYYVPIAYDPYLQ